ncbi:transposase [Streptomyces olivoreticuli]
MAELVGVRRLTDQEGQKPQQIVRRGSTSSMRYRPAMMMLASVGGNRVLVTAQLVQADEDTVRSVIHRFPVYVILDNLSAHKDEKIHRWAKKHRVKLCFTLTYASWANPVEAHFGPLRQFTIANSNHRSHTVQTRALHAYLRWRNKNVRYPDVLAARRRERARIHSEKGIRWG